MHSKILKLLRSAGSFRWALALVRHGVAAAAEHGVVLGQLGDVRCIVDIGANRGQFALVCRAKFPEATIISFEPLPEPATKFRAVFRGDARVQLHEVAVGESASEAMMHVSDRDDSSSLLPISALQVALFPGTAEKTSVTVAVRALDDCIEPHSIARPALLKLDVQGFELAALSGCESMLDRFSFVYAECSFVELYCGQALAPDVIGWLQRRHFLLVGIFNMHCDRNGRPIQADFLFAKRRHDGEVN